MDRSFKTFIVYLGSDAGGTSATLCVGPRGEPRVTGPASRGLSESLDSAASRQPNEVRRTWAGRVREAREIAECEPCADRRKLNALRIAEKYLEMVAR